MFGKKKTTGAATPVPQVSNKKKVEDYLTSMSFLSHFVIDKKESLVEEEINLVGVLTLEDLHILLEQSMYEI